MNAFTRRCLMLGASVASLSLVGGTVIAGDHGPIKWGTSIAKATKAAAATKKLILLDFTADWCGPCQQMLKTTYKDAKVVERAKKFESVLVDIDKQPEPAKKFSVEGIPTMIVLDAKGKVLGRNTGYVDAPTFLKFLDDAAKKAGK